MSIRGILLFLHVLGFALWFGVTLTLALLGVRVRKSGEPAAIAFVYRSSSGLLRGPGLAGMLLTIGSGFGLTAVSGYGYFRPFPDHWLFQMQLLGTIALLLALLVQLPNAERLARAAEASAAAGEDSASFVRFRKRNALVASIVGTLLLIVALLGAVRPGA
jgi:putative copper export protein